MAGSTYKINIVVNSRNAQRGTKKVNAGLQSVKAHADQARHSIGRMFVVMASIALIRGTIRMMADFEQSISTIAAVTGATTSQMQEMTKAAEQLGITTRFSAVEAADGLVLLSRAGFTASEALSAIGHTLRLAQAGGLELAQAAEITANTLRAFGIEAANTERVVDVLAKASNSANTTVLQLGEGLKFVAPIARGLGVSMETTTAALAKLADAGQKATLGGTGLRRVMAALEAPTAKAQRTLRAMGLSSEDVRISSVGLTAALTNMAKAGITTTEMFAIFGRRSGTSAAVLLKNIAAVDAMDKSLQGAGGTASDMAKIMDDNLNGALFRSSSAVKGFAISLSQAGLSAGLTSTLEGVANAFRFLATNIEFVAPALAAMAVAMTASLIPAITTMIVKMGLLNAAILFNPLTLYAAAIAALATAYWGLDKSIAATNKVLADEAKLSTKGKALLDIREKILQVQKMYAAGMAKEPGLLEGLLVKEREMVKALQDRTKETNKNLKAQAELIPTTDSIINGLDRQISALGELTNAEKVAEKVAAEVARIRQASTEAVVTDQDKERLRLKFEELALAKRLNRVVKEALGPQDKTKQTIKDLGIALKIGRISANQFAIAMRGLRTELESIPKDNPFKDQAASLKLINAQLLNRLQNTGALQRFREVEIQMAAQGKTLSDEEKARLVALIMENERLNKVISDRNKLMQEAANKVAQTTQEDAQIAKLLKQVDVLGLITKQRERLLLLAADPANALMIDQINLKLQDLQLQGLETSTALEDGFTRAFLKIRQEANDFASVGEDITNIFADQATDALVKFAETGKFAFKEFASAILKDITRIIARLLVMQAISAAAGGLGIGVPATVAGARADGGPVQAGRSYLVGEKGPELLQMGNQSGNIVPNNEIGGGQQSPVNLQVVNVTDPDEVPQAINDGGSDEAIMNVIARNQDRMRGMF